MLCSRSASFTSSTRTSSAMASSSLRRFSACFASRVTRSSFFSLVRPSTRCRDVLAEQALDLGAGRLGVLDRVVQQRRRDRRVIELEVGEDRGDFQRVREIGVAGGALLLAMRPHGINVGAVEQLLVDLGIIFAHPIDEIVLAHHALGRRRLRHRLPHHLPMLPRRADARLVLHAREFIRRARHSDQVLAASQRLRFPVASSIRLTRARPSTIRSRACA